MKKRVTIKSIRETSNNLVRVGYADLQHLLMFRAPYAYNAGVYGWNFDVYDVHGVTICTGYRGCPGRRANNATEYERRAAEICKNARPGEIKEKIEQLLSEFCAQA